MAETNGSTPKPKRRVRIRFVAAVPAPMAGEDDPLVLAANPQPSWTLQVTEAGTPNLLGEYGLWHPMDLASGETLKLLSIERETAGLPGDAYIMRIREQVQLLVPDLPDEVFERLTAQQLLAVGTRAWQRPGETRHEAASREADAGNPPAGERASGSSSRSPVGSTDGATRS